MHRIPKDLGEQGCDQVSSTVATTVASGFVWFAIQGMWSATVFSTLTDLSRFTGTTGTVALFVNNVIYGAFTNFTLTSGAIRCYRQRAG
jgi:hypothetical protein